MSSTQPIPEPHDFKACLFHYTLRLFNAVLPRSVRSFMYLFLFKISPDIPVSLTSAWRDASLNGVFVVAASLTFIMCFVVVFVWSAIAGTLIGSDPSRLYFLKDWVNLLNYTLLCPLYVGFGAVLIATIAQGSAELRQLSSPDGTGSHPVCSYTSVFLLLLLILVVALFVNAEFMAENMNPSIYTRSYWFMAHDRPDGSRVIGAFGFYYGLLNFCLLFFSLLVVAAFLAEFRLLVQIAKSLDRLETSHSLTTEVLRKRLTTFTQAYLAGKLVVASYMANALVWKTSQAQHSTDLVVLGAALTFFGVVFLSIPRYYIELQWFRLQTARPNAAVPDPKYEDLRPWKIDFVGGPWKTQLVVGIIDTVIIGTFFTGFWL
jgi:hypothetical protein